MGWACFTSIQLGEEKFTFVDEVKNPKSVTLLIKELQIRIRPSKFKMRCATVCARSRMRSKMKHSYLARAHSRSRALRILSIVPRGLLKGVSKWGCKRMRTHFS